MDEAVVQRLQSLRTRFVSPFYENASYGYGGFVHERDSTAEEFIQMSRTAVRSSQASASAIASTSTKAAAAGPASTAVSASSSRTRKRTPPAAIDDRRVSADNTAQGRLTPAKRKRSPSLAPIELLSPTLPPQFEQVLSGKGAPASSPLPPPLLSPTLPPQFAIKLETVRRAPKAAEPPPTASSTHSSTKVPAPSTTTVRSDQTPRSAPSERTLEPPASVRSTLSTADSVPETDLVALSKLMSTRGRECKHAAQGTSPYSKLHGLDAVLCFLSHYHLDEQARTKQSKPPSLALIRSLEEFFIWVNCIKTKTESLQMISHLTLAAMYHHISRTEQKHAKALLKSVDTGKGAEVTLRRDLFELLRRSLESSEKALVYYRKTGSLLELPFLKQHFPSTFAKLHDTACQSRFVYPVSFASPVREVVNFCRALLEEMPDSKAMGGLKSVVL